MSATLSTMASVNDTTSGVSVSATKTVTATGTALDLRILEIGTDEEEVTISTEIGDCGICFIHNLDSTNYVEVGFSTESYPIKILAGQFALMPIAAATASLFFKANTAACDVKFYCHEA